MKLNEIFSSSNFLTDRQEIIEWLRENTDIISRANFTIRPSGIVDVHGDISFKPIKRFKVQFGTIEGNFGFTFDDPNIEGECLESLDGCPQTVQGNFDISKALSESVRTLEGGPTEVHGEFYFVDSPYITSFEGMPKALKTLNIWESGITSLVGISKHFSYLETLQVTPVIWSDEFSKIKEGGIELLNIHGFREITASYDKNPKWADIIMKYIGRPDDIFECQAELIENGLEEFAKL